MLVLFVLSLTVLGVTGDDDCTGGGRECDELLVFSGNSFREFEESGKLLPPDEFFQLNCNTIVDVAKCVTDYVKKCDDLRVPVDTDAILDNVIEFCDEDSALRKGYRDHVACLNRFEVRSLENNTCFKSAEYALGAAVFGGIQPEREINLHCFALHAFGSCFVDLAEDSCGEEAGQLITDFLSRGKDIFDCSKDDEEYIEKFVDDLLTKVLEDLEELEELE